VLKLPKLERVECYDVSNLNFKEATASMVVFNKAEAQPENYRRFKIKNRRVFDPEMLLEVLQRRFKHPEWPTPDLIVIDGGSPQILKIVPKIKNPKTPMIIGLAKKPDRIILPSLSTLVLKPDSLALNYLQKMRDEAHRFAKKYHLYLRQKVLLELKDRVK
jgi:excinuclease ABC subunit C